MARQLDVYWEAARVGILEQTDAGKLRFRYDGAWLADSARPSLSLSLPRRAAVFNDREARPFFAGLLPEAEKRDGVAHALGVSRRNDFALLDGIGGECAGAITFVPAGNSPPPSATQADYRRLDEAELDRILRLLPERPLLAGEQGVRLSLAGAQDKLPVLAVGGEISLPLNSAPSSHIVKPRPTRFADVVFNEAFCLHLAHESGFDVIAAEIRQAKDIEYLLVERYDRRRDAAGLHRVHQEDFCQALGIPPELKYQSEGGPSLKDCFRLAREALARPVVDLAHLLDVVVFNLVVGNNDAHGKNFSILYAADGARLAPLYDVSSTVVYHELSPRSAMRIGDAYLLDDLRPRDWERFAKDTGLGPAQVRRRVTELARTLPRTAATVRDAFASRGHARRIIDEIVATIDERSRRVLQTVGPAGA